MKKPILIIVTGSLLVGACSRQPEKGRPPRDTLAERVDLIGRAAAVRRTADRAAETRDRQINEMFPTRPAPTPAGWRPGRGEDAIAD